MFGYSFGYIGGLLVLPSFNRHFALDGLSKHDQATTQSLIVSLWLLGALGGVIVALPVCSHLGRQKCLAFCAVTYVIGAALQLIPSRRAMAIFNIGGLLNGIGVGASTLVAPLYISEISRHSHRGVLLAAWQVLIQTATLIGFWGPYISHCLFPDTSGLQWEVPVAIQVVPGAIMLFGSFFLPESPIWLAEQQDLDASRKALAWLRLEDVSLLDVHQIVLHRKGLEALRPESGSFKEIFRRPIRKRLICGTGLMTLMALSGVNTLNFFAPTIFNSAGFASTSASLFLTGLFGLVKLAAALAFMFYFVRVKGYRFLIIMGSAACSVASFILAFCARTFESHPAQQPRWPGSDNFSVPGVLACFLVFTFAFFFGIGHGPVAWNFCAEVFPAHLSTKCCAITTCTQWFFLVVNAIATPFLLTRAGWYTWIIFGCVNAITLVWCILYFPETPLGETMDAVFEGYPKAKHDDLEEVEEVIVVGEETPLLKAQGCVRTSEGEEMTQPCTQARP